MTMACSCQHNKDAISHSMLGFEELRELFIKRMTVDSEHNDRRKKDYNQAIFDWWEEDKAEADPSKTFPCWCNMSMDMVLRCFDDAVKDWRKSWCDSENCRRR